MSDPTPLELAYKKALAGENGKKIIADLNYYRNRTSFTEGDSLTTAYKEGERALANYILNQVEKDYED